MLLKKKLISKFKGQNLNITADDNICFSIFYFIKLQSIYSKNLYRLYTEYQDKSTYAFSIEAFREFLDINSRYPH